MGVEIKLTDKEFPVSASFVDFLWRHLKNEPFEASWHDQLSEELLSMSDALRDSANRHVGEVMENAEGQRLVYRSYQLFTAFLTGVPDQFRSIHERYKFICVVGVPRHGGSYLVKQLYRAIGLDPDTVPNVIAHDGFPDASPFDFASGYNAYTNMMQNMAEYLAMVEVFFANSRVFDNRIVVPKKATKAAYHGAFFDKALGPGTEYVITLRHPVTACISTYEKSTGLPEGAKFRARGNIEEWVRRDNLYTGVPESAIPGSDYFDLYLNYWEHYHHNLVLTGLRLNPNWRLVVYSKEAMEAEAAGYFARFRSRERADEFKVFDKRGRHPEWMRRSEAVVLRVRDSWRTAGLEFPVDPIMEAW